MQQQGSGLTESIKSSKCCISVSAINSPRQYRELVESGSHSAARAGRLVVNKNLIQEIYSGPEFVCIFKTFCMIKFLTKPSINDSWSVLLFDFQSDNPEFLIGWRQEKGENLFTKSIVPQSEAAVGITFLHRLSTKTDTKKENASETGQKHSQRALCHE